MLLCAEMHAFLLDMPIKSFICFFLFYLVYFRVAILVKMAVITENGCFIPFPPPLPLVQECIKVTSSWFSKQGGSNKIYCALTSDRVGNWELLLPLTLVAAEVIWQQEYQRDRCSNPHLVFYWLKSLKKPTWRRAMSSYTHKEAGRGMCLSLFGPL